MPMPLLAKTPADAEEPENCAVAGRNLERDQKAFNFPVKQSLLNNLSPTAIRIDEERRRVVTEYRIAQ